MNLHLPAAAALLACAASLGIAAERLRPTEGRPRGASAVLGGFSALAAQGLWLRAERAQAAHREDEALVCLRAIADLEPHVVSAARYIAFEIGAGIAAGRADPETRWNLTREGFRALDRAIEENPREPDAWANRAYFTMLRVVKKDDMAAIYRKRVDPKGPELAAQRDFAQAVELNPLDIESRLGVAVAATRRAHLLAESGLPSEAADSFDAAAAAYDGLIETLTVDEYAPESRMGLEIAALRQSRDEVAGLAGVARAAAAAPPERR